MLSLPPTCAKHLDCPGFPVNRWQTLSLSAVVPFNNCPMFGDSEGRGHWVSSKPPQLYRLLILTGFVPLALWGLCPMMHQTVPSSADRGIFNRDNLGIFSFLLSKRRFLVLQSIGYKKWGLVQGTTVTLYYHRLSLRAF